MSNPIAVITTINEPTEAVKKVASRMELIAVGDKKSPDKWSLDNTTFINPPTPPFNHYARKNLGYLAAIKKGATAIFDTDDDNAPNENWKVRDAVGYMVTLQSEEKWCNVYREFGANAVWPRGYALSEITKNTSFRYNEPQKKVCFIHQCMADGEADVDAIFRLTTKQMVRFHKNSSILLYNLWCPFNSQATWWFPPAYPLMYLPSFASFRMTDIWRSFVAQRCLWETGTGVAFHSPAEVTQIRNPHNLMKDFKEEIPGYLNNHEIASALGRLQLGHSIFENMILCYEEMIRIKVLPQEEMISLLKWVGDVKDE